MLVIGKMKDEIGRVAIKEFVEYKKARDVNKNGLAKISYNEYKDILLNKICLKYSMIRIQSKNHKISTYKISKISLSCFDDKFIFLIMKMMRWLLVIRV